MKKGLRSSLLTASAATLIALGVSSGARATTLYWDGTNAVADGSISGGTGNWVSGTTNWTNAAGTVNSAWVNNIPPDDAVFAGASGTVSYGFTGTVGNLTFNVGGYTLARTGGTLYLNDGSVITTATGTTTFTGLVSGTNVSVTKSGSGALVLSSANGTLTGTLSITDGALIANNASNGSAFGSSVVNIGDGVGASASAVLQMAQNNNNPFTNADTLVTFNVNSDGQFDLGGKTIGGSNSFRFLTFNFANGGSVVGNGSSLTNGGTLVLNSNNSSTGTTLTLAGTGTYAAAGGDVVIRSPGTSLSGTSRGGTVTLAVNAGANLITQGGSIYLTSANNGGTTLSGNITVSSTGGGLIDTGTGVLSFGSGTNNVASAVNTISRAGVAGDTSVLTINGRMDLGLAGGLATQSNRTLNLTSTGISTPGADNIVINAVISDGAGNSNNGIVKSGSMSVALLGNNTYTGTTSVTLGNLYAVDGVGLPTNSNLAISGAGVFESHGSLTRSLGTAANQLSWASGGFSARGGDLTLAIGGTASPTALTLNSTTNFVNNTMTFGSYLSDSRVNFVNSIAFNGVSLTATVLDNVNSAGDYTEWSGLITGTAGTLTKAGPGLLVLSNTGNSSSSVGLTISSGVVRATTVSALVGGRLQFTSTASASASILESSGTFTRSLGTGANNLSWGAAAIGGFAAVGDDLHVRLNNGTNSLAIGAGNFVTATGALAFGSSTADHTVYYENGLGLGSSGSTATIQVTRGVSASNPEVIFTNTISGAANLNKTGNGRMVVTATNSYTGSTTVSAGSLLVSGAGSINTTSGISVNGSGAEFSYSSSVGLTQTVTIGAGGGKFTYNSSAKYTGGALSVGSGGVVGGSGVLGAVTIASGGTLAPGNSPGNLTTDTQTWQGGGSYSWEIDNATGTKGTNWDLTTISAGNNLNITATSGSKFTIYVTGLNGLDVSGTVPNFNSSSNYTWTIATVGVGGSITGFDVSAFTIDTTGFTNNNPISPFGTFSLAVQGSDLNLVYAVPEPSSVALIGCGLAGGLFLYRRRRPNA